jgi:hypothetical protein
MQLNLKRVETRLQPVEHQLLQLNLAEILQLQAELRPQSQHRRVVQPLEQQTKLTRASQGLTLALKLQKLKPDETKPRQVDHQHLSHQGLKNLALEQLIRQTKASQLLILVPRLLRLRLKEIKLHQVERQPLSQQLLRQPQGQQTELMQGSR